MRQGGSAVQRPQAPGDADGQIARLIRNAAMVACRHLDAGMDFRPHEFSMMVPLCFVEFRCSAEHWWGAGRCGRWF